MWLGGKGSNKTPTITVLCVYKQGGSSYCLQLFSTSILLTKQQCHHFLKMYIKQITLQIKETKQQQRNASKDIKHQRLFQPKI